VVKVKEGVSETYQKHQRSYPPISGRCRLFFRIHLDSSVTSHTLLSRPVIVYNPSL